MTPILQFPNPSTDPNVQLCCGLGLLLAFGLWVLWKLRG